MHSSTHHAVQVSILIDSLKLLTGVRWKCVQVPWLDIGVEQPVLLLVPPHASFQCAEHHSCRLDQVTGYHGDMYES